MIRAWVCGLCLCVAFPAFAGKVVCPEGLKWVFEGYCKLDFDYKKMGSCPQGSKMAKPEVMGPLICYSKGLCPDSTKPNVKGFCVDPDELPKKPS